MVAAKNPRHKSEYRLDKMDITAIRLRTLASIGVRIRSGQRKFFRPGVLRRY